MDKSVKLVFVPGTPVALTDLSQKTHFIMAENRLAMCGINAETVDFGVMEGVQVTKEVEEKASVYSAYGWIQRLSHGRGGFPVSYKNNDTAYRFDQLTTKLQRLQQGSPRLFVFWVEDKRCFSEVRQISEQLRLEVAEADQVVAGPYARQYGSCILGECPTFNAVLLGDMVESLDSFLHKGDFTWHDVPNVIYRDTLGTLRKTSGYISQKIRLNPCVEKYVNLMDGFTRFPIFPLCFTEYPDLVAYQDRSGNEIRKKSTDTLIDEIEFFMNRYNARVFHISAPFITLEQLKSFADRLLGQNLVIIYSLGDISVSVGKALAEELFASGCRSISFRIPTGSQRLLEEFYGCKMSTSAMRVAMRFCSMAGMFTVVKLCYPCPQDDYHTRAETELLIESGKPDAVCLESPVITPNSYWFNRAYEFGFFINHRDFNKDAIGFRPTFGNLPYTMRGWSSKRVSQAQESLLVFAMNKGCFINVGEQAGLLAKLSRNDLDESVFLTRLQEAIEDGNSHELKALATLAYSNCDTSLAEFDAYGANTKMVVSL